jgi:PST family polysaccharide transporter
MIVVSRSFRTQLLTILSGNGVVAAANFVGFIYLARTLGPLTVGIYASAIVLVDVAIAFVNFGFNQAVIRHKGSLEIYKAAVAAVIVQCVVVLLVGSSIVAFAWSGALHGLEPVWLPLAIACLRVIGLLTTILYAQHEVALNYGIITRGQVLAAISANIVAASIVQVNQGIFALLTRDAFTALVMLTTFWRHRRRGIGPSFERAPLRKLFEFSSRMWVLNGLEVVCARTDSLIVSRLLGATAMGGYYSLRSICDGVAVFVIRPIQTLVFAKYCRLEEPIPIRSLMARMAGPYVALVGLAAIVLAKFADTAIGLALGPRFIPVASSLPWLAFGAGCIIWYENLKVLGMATGFVAPAMVARVVQIVVIIGAGFAFIPAYHATGAAMAFGAGALALVAMATIGFALSAPTTRRQER